MVMDSIVATHDGVLNGYTALTIAGADERYFIPAAGSTVARFPTPGYVERVIFGCEAAAGVSMARGRIRLGTTQPQTMPCTFKASHDPYATAGPIPYAGDLSAPRIGIPVPKDEVLSIDADNNNEAVANSVVLFIRRDAPGIAPLKTYERVTRQNATVTTARVANTWTPPTAMVFEGVLEQNKLYHLLGAALVEEAQQEALIAARFRQVETAIGGKLDPRPTCLGARMGVGSRFVTFPEVIAFPGSAPPAIELVDDTSAQQPLALHVELLLGEVGVLSPGQMQQQAQRAQAQQAIPWN